MARPNREWRYATSAQCTYLRRLNEQCFSKRIEGYYIRDWDSLLKSEASSMIQTLKDRLEKKKLEG